MKIRLSVSLTVTKPRDETPGEPHMEGSFAQAEIANPDPDINRMPTGFTPPEGRLLDKINEAKAADF